MAKKSISLYRFGQKFGKWLYYTGTFRIQNGANGEFSEQTRDSGEGCSLSAAHVYMMYNALAIRIIQTALLAAVMHIDLKLTGASGRGSVLIMMHHQVLILCNISNPMSSIFKTWKYIFSLFTWAEFHFSSPPPWAIAINWGTTSSVIAIKCHQISSIAISTYIATKSKCDICLLELIESQLNAKIQLTPARFPLPCPSSAHPACYLQC